MSILSKLRDKDVLSGAIFAGTGLAFTIQSFDLSMGTPAAMGPGYMPAVLSVLLIGFGLAVLARGLLRGGGIIPAVSVRGLAAIIAALLIFAFSVRGAGLGPSVFVMVLVSCLGSTRARPLPSLLLALGLTAFCWAVFVFALGLPLSLIGPWLGGF